MDEMYRNSTQECQKVNCGEGGCYYDQVLKEPKCVCLRTGQPPDEDGMCPMNFTHIQSPLFNLSQLGTFIVKITPEIR